MNEFNLTLSVFDSLPNDFKRELLELFRELLAFDGYIIRVDEDELRDRESLSDWIIKRGYGQLVK